MADPVSPPHFRPFELIWSEEQSPLKTAASFYPDHGSGPPCLRAVVKHVVVGVARWRLEAMATP